MNNFQNIKKITILFFVLSAIFSIVLTITVFKLDYLPKKYVIQSQLLIEPKINNIQTETITNYLDSNEDYSILMYSPEFLDKILQESEYETLNELKNHIQIIFSNDSHVLTLQQTVYNKKSGLEFAEIALSEFLKYASKIISYNELSIISKPYIIQTYTPSKSLIFLSLLSFLFCLMLLIYFMFKNKYKD